MNVHYFSATEIISALLKKKVNGTVLGNIVLISSNIVALGGKYQPPCCASRSAINGLNNTLACELAPRWGDTILWVKEQSYRVDVA